MVNQTNNYDALSNDYVRTDEKPDKKYSIGVTALKVVGPLSGKTVVDVGCGDGFLTKLFAREAEFVYGIDNSSEQIEKTAHLHNVKYVLADMKCFQFPTVDMIFSPFVLNYLQTAELKPQLQRFYDGLTSDGTLAGIVDRPKSTVHNMKKFG